MRLMYIIFHHHSRPIAVDTGMNFLSIRFPLKMFHKHVFRHLYNPLSKLYAEVSLVLALKLDPRRSQSNGMSVLHKYNPISRRKAQKKSTTLFAMMSRWPTREQATSIVQGDCFHTQTDNVTLIPKLYEKSQLDANKLRISHHSCQNRLWTDKAFVQPVTISGFELTSCRLNCMYMYVFSISMKYEYMTFFLYTV